MKSVSSLDVHNTVRTDRVNERTLDRGVTVDGVLLKDSGITVTGIKVPVNAVVGYVLKCDNALTGNATWLPDEGGTAGSTAPFSDDAPLVKNATDASKRMRFDTSAVPLNTTCVIHVPNVDVQLPNQDVSIAAQPSFAGLALPTGAVVNRILTCSNGTSGAATWAVAPSTFSDNALTVQNAASATRQARFDTSAVPLNTTCVIHVPNVDVQLPNQDVSTTAQPSFAGLLLPTNAVQDYVLTCTSGSGAMAWAPSQGGGGGTTGVVVETASYTPYTVSNASVADEIEANPVNSTYIIYLPVIGASHRIVTIRNLSTTQDINLQRQGSDIIWGAGRTQLTISPNSYTTLDGGSGVWLSI